MGVSSQESPGTAAGRRAARRARERMLRRRRRAILVALLLLVTTGWVWHTVNRPERGAAARGTSSRFPVLGDVGWLQPTPATRPAAGPTTAAVHREPSPGSDRYVNAGSTRLVVVAGTSRVYGSGPLRRYMVEVEAGIGEDPRAFAAFVERTLADRRSWGHAGALSLQRVDSGPVAFRVTLASPATVDKYCAPLDTKGYTSCYDGRGRAMLNQARWETGVQFYADDLTTYRQYMVNHEVGHALGHGHQQCPAPGALAPSMQQQTLGLQGCRRNAWPYP